MKLVRILSFVGVVLAAAALAVGFVSGQDAIWLIAIIGVGAAWAAAEWRGWGWLATLSFVADIWLAAFGIGRAYDALWMAAAVVLALAAWTLGQFYHRASGLLREEDQEVIVRRMLLRVAALSLISLALAYVALIIEVNLTFGLALLGGVVLIIGLSRIVGSLRRQSD